MVAGKASRVFKFASVDSRESFLDVVTPLKEAQAAQQPSVVPKKSIQEAVFAANKDVAALYQRCAPGVKRLHSLPGISYARGTRSCGKPAVQPGKWHTHQHSCQ